MIFHHPIRIVRQLCPIALWRMDRADRSVYLTFDDGPIPESTPWILDELDRQGVKATFFVVGDNVNKYPDLFQTIVSRGHRIGNHTFHHLQGRRCSVDAYLADVALAQQTMEETTPPSPKSKPTPKLFRPPHGYLRPSQQRALESQYQLVQWDIVTRDYAPRVTADKIVHRIQRNVRNGSIITFHDSLRTIDKLPVALPEAIQWMRKQGYEFKLL